MEHHVANAPRDDGSGVYMTKQAIKTDESMADMVRRIAADARTAYADLAKASNEKKDMALVASAMAIREHATDILAANAKDVAFAKEKGLSDAMIDRLVLNEKRIEAMAQGLETVATLPDPVNKLMDEWERPNGLVIQRVSIPLGVIGIIYESRPNVTADAAGLCIKSGNACILRGGSESLHSSEAIVDCLRVGLKAANLPENCVQIVPVRDREAVGEMLNAVGLIDVIVPRGGKSLNQRVQMESKIPTILHLDGNCHIYVHKAADAAMARDVILNAKMRRTGICGAAESIVIDESALKSHLPSIVDALIEEHCEIRGDKAAQAVDKRIKAAEEADWGTEYLDAIISVKTVKTLEEAISHINRFGSHHTDSIITSEQSAARKFLREVDSAIVMHNTSTQFADGGEFGFGSEIGISTGRLHARGPVGTEQLTTYKYVIHGTGQTRE
jgi:glutamate-5-semialdehyde dehydrogenase